MAGVTTMFKIFQSQNVQLRGRIIVERRGAKLFFGSKEKLLKQKLVT